MILEFNVNDNQILKRTDNQDIVNKTNNYHRCRFTFQEESEWVNLNKFVIFTDGWGNTSTVHLGRGSTVLCCLIPDNILRGSYFKVSLYGGELYTTNDVSIPLIQSGYNHHRPSKSCNLQKDIFVEIFERIDSKISNIAYDDYCIHTYDENGFLIESIFLPFATTEDINNTLNTLTDLINNKADETHTHNLVDSEVDGFMSSMDKVKLDTIEEGANYTITDTVLDTTSDNPIANSVVTLALDGKENTFDFVERMDNVIVDLIQQYPSPNTDDDGG